MGSGIERVHEASRRGGGPELEIEYNTMFSLEFPKPTYITTREPGETREKTREKIKNREKIFSLILDDPKITIAQMAEKLGLTSKGIEWQIARLKKEVVYNPDSDST